MKQKIKKVLSDFVYYFVFAISLLVITLIEIVIQANILTFFHEKDIHNFKNLVFMFTVFNLLVWFIITKWEGVLYSFINKINENGTHSGNQKEFPQKRKK